MSVLMNTIIFLIQVAQVKKTSSVSLQYYYHYSFAECDCSDGSVNQSCDAISGQCQCLPGASSRQCDTCAPFYQIIEGTSGCQPCDECTISLLTVNSDINDTLTSIETKTVMATELQQVDTLDLELVQIRVTELYELLNRTTENLTIASDNLNRLEETRNNLSIDLSELESMVRHWKVFQALYKIRNMYQ